MVIDQSELCSTIELTAAVKAENSWAFEPFACCAPSPVERHDQDATPCC